MLTQTDIERERYEARWKLQLDNNTFKKVMEMERAEGIAKGHAVGFVEGQLLGRIQLCQTLLKQPVATRESLGHLTQDQLQSLANNLELQLVATRP